MTNRNRRHSCAPQGPAGRPVRTVALNAGVGAGGAFTSDTTLEDELRIVDLNVRSMGPSRQAIANRQLRCNAESSFC